MKENPYWYVGPHERLDGELAVATTAEFMQLVQAVFLDSPETLDPAFQLGMSVHLSLLNHNGEAL